MNNEKIRQQIKELDTDNIIKNIDITDYRPHEQKIYVDFYFANNIQLRLEYYTFDDNITILGSWLLYRDSDNFDSFSFIYFVYINKREIKKIIKDNL